MDNQNQPTLSQGFVLPVGLVLLLLLSLISISSLRDVNTEQKITHNFVDKQHSFQRAENALKIWEQFIGNLDIKSIEQLTGYIDVEKNPDLFFDPDSFNWSNATSHKIVIKSEGDVVGLGIVEKIQSIASPIIGRSQNKNITKRTFFRLTVKASGEKPNTYSIVQSTLGKLSR